MLAESQQAAVGGDRGFNASAWLVDRHLAAGKGAAIAFRCGTESQSYAEVAGAVDRAANGLMGLGVVPHDRVLMVVNDELAFPAVYLAGLRIGAIPVPVSTMLRAPDLASIAADSGATTVVVSERYVPYLATITGMAPDVTATVIIGKAGGGLAADVAVAGGVRVVAWDSWQDSTPVPPAPTTAATPGFWLYTSGTTGRPKGAIHRHGDIEAVCRTYASSVLGIGPDDVCYSVPKLFFAFGLGNSLLFPLAVGASAVLDPEPATPARAAELLEHQRPTLFFSPPGLCAALVDRGAAPAAFSSVRATVTAGEAFPAETMRRFTGRFGVEVLDGIGSTEALHIFCSNHPGDVRPGTSGTPVTGYDLKLLADDGSEITAADTPGALWIRGESIADGYWQRPDVTAATFVDGWLRTGDVYSRSADGYWKFVGRNSDMIKAGGIWVSPAEVENVLLAHDNVLEAAVVAGARDIDGLESVVAFVVARTGATIDVAELKAHCHDRMAGFKRPRQIEVVDELPKTATGKIQRFALRDNLTVQLGANAGMNPPNRILLQAGPVEYRLAPAAASGRLAPLVLLHEGLGCLALWRQFHEALAARTGRAVLVYSRHGYGRSGPVLLPRPVTYMHNEALVVLPELLDRLEIESPVLVGHSDGASIALIHAGGARRGLEGLILIAPHVYVEDHGLAGIEAARQAYLSTDLPARLGRYHDDPDATFWGWNDVWLSPDFRSWNIEDYLPGVAVPALAVQSVDDEYGTLAQLARIEAATTGPTEMLVTERGCHFPHLRQADQVLGGVVAWLAGVG